MAPDRLPALPSEQDRRPGPQAGTAARMSNFRITPNALSHKLKLHQLQIRTRAGAPLAVARRQRDAPDPAHRHQGHPRSGGLRRDVVRALQPRRHADRAGAGAGPARARHDGRDPLHGRRHRRGARRRQRPRGRGHADRGLGQAAARGHRAADDRASRHPGHGARGPVGAAAAGAATGDVDIVVGRLPGADMASISGVAVDHHKLYREDLCLVAGASHPLAGAARVSLAELADHIWILPAPTSPLRARSSAASTPACACPRVTSNRCRC